MDSLCFHVPGAVDAQDRLSDGERAVVPDAEEVVDDAQDVPVLEEVRERERAAAGRRECGRCEQGKSAPLLRAAPVVTIATNSILA